MRQIQYQMYFTRHSGNDLDAFIDNNTLTVTYPGSSWSDAASQPVTYSWTASANWNNGVPIAGTPALLSRNGSGSDINFDGDYSSAALSELYIDAKKSPMTLHQSANTMRATVEYIGNAGNGTYLQTGGVNTANITYIGYYTGSTGTYSISNGSLNVGTLHLAAQDGAGSLTVSGNASVNASILDLGGVSPSDGLYVNGGGVTIGTLALEFGSKHVSVSAGNLTISQVNVVGTGTYLLSLSGGSLTLPSLALFDSTHFAWTGGTLTVNADIAVGPSDSFAGNLTLSNGQVFNLQSLTNVGNITTSAPSRIAATNLLNYGNITGSGDIVINSTQQAENHGNISVSGLFQCSNPFFNFGNITLSGQQSWPDGATFPNHGFAFFNSDAGSSLASPLTIAVNQNEVHLRGVQHLQAALCRIRRSGFIEGSATKVNDFFLDGTLTLRNGILIQESPTDKLTNMNELRNDILVGLTFPAGLKADSLAPNNALAILDNAATAFISFAGLSVDADSIIVAAELIGDANADGTIDLSDLSTVLNNFGATTPAWTSGNFDDQPTIDLTDLSDVLNNFGQSLHNPAAGIIPTPEPATLLLLTPLVWSSAFRRRRPPMRSEA